MNVDQAQSVSIKEFEDIFWPLDDSRVREYISQLDLRYLQIVEDEHNLTVLDCFRLLLRNDLPKSGEHRRDAWEAGWAQNATEFQKNPTISNLVPRYFGKHSIARWRQRFVKPNSKLFEASMLSAVLRIVANKYLSNVEHIAEFGCGTGVNLLDFRAVNKLARITGLDWSVNSQKIVTELAKSSDDSNLKSRPFDFFAPDYSFDLGENSAVVTVAALEQVGDMSEPFIQYLLAIKPRICVHLEPIPELLDSSNVLDFLSIQYFRQRQYLSGFLPRLQELEDSGEIQILEGKRSFSGSLYIEGHSLIVWAPRL